MIGDDSSPIVPDAIEKRSHALCRYVNGQQRVSNASAILRQVEQSSRDFRRETDTRRRLLQGFHEVLERQVQAPEIEPIVQQLVRLAVYHQQVSRRYQQRFRKPPLRTVQPVAADPGDWRAYHWQLDNNLRPVSNLHNAVAALRESPMLSGLVALDLSQNAIMLKGPLPLAHWETFDFEMRRPKEADLSGLLEYLQSIGLVSLSRDDCLAAVRLIAAENAWRPADE